MVELKFNNRDSKTQSVSIMVDETAVDQIMSWYGGYCAGDNYTVRVNGKLIRIDGNGERVA